MARTEKILEEILLRGVDVTGATVGWEVELNHGRSDGFADINSEDGNVYRHWAGLNISVKGHLLYRSRPDDARPPLLLGIVDRTA